MSSSVIRSKDNPLVRTFRLVAAQARRAPADLVLAEGIRVLEEATHSHCRIEAALASESFGSHPREKALLAAWQSRGVAMHRAADAVLKVLSEVAAMQGALALVRVPARSLKDMPVCTRPLILCLCEIRDPGNLGALLRSARAAGATWAASTCGSVSAGNPKAVRAGAGSTFHLPLLEGLQPAALIDYCSSREIPVYRADAGRGTPCWEVDLRGAAALLLGNEARGLGGDFWSGIPAIRIPMATGAESLNVAAAGAVLLFEARRQRSGILATSPDRT